VLGYIWFFVVLVLKPKSAHICVVARSIRRALSIFSVEGQLTAREIQRYLDVSTKTAYDVISYLLDKRLIVRVARGKYRITKKGKKVAEILSEL